MNGTTGLAPTTPAAAGPRSVAYCDPSLYGVQGGIAWASYSMTLSGFEAAGGGPITTATAVTSPDTTTPPPGPWPCPQETFPTVTYTIGTTNTPQTTATIGPAPPL